MGIDVFGENPKNETGNYFRRSGGWPPLARYIVENCPKSIYSHCRNWFSTEGDGLDQTNSLLLASVLISQIADGSAEKFISTMGEEPGMLTTDDLYEFAQFLQNCGGFRIL
jgi:hypothetical protein